jgi:hypothetical protein
MEDELLSMLKQQLDDVAMPVGFAFAGTAEALDETSAPDQTLTWVSSFAVLALIPIASTELHNLTALEGIAREWMWRRLTKYEQSGKFLDGYLVFALPMKPDETTRGTIQTLELDTAVCRKHVIWPLHENDWRAALWKVTVLGLPPVQPSAVTLATLPKLPELASRALKLYLELENYETTAETLRQEAHTEADKEASDAS